MIIAWHGEQALKDAAIARLKEHQRLDQIVQGQYWRDDGKGCLLGCLTHADSYSHSAAERLFGIEERVGCWLEAIFERLPIAAARELVIDSTTAIPVGADLSLCHHHLVYWLLGPDSPSSKGNAHPSVSAEIAAMRELHRLALDGQPSQTAAWSAAWSAAWEPIADQSLEIFRAAPVPGAKTDCPECVTEAMEALGRSGTLLDARPVDF